MPIHVESRGPGGGKYWIVQTNDRGEAVATVEMTARDAEKVARELRAHLEGNFEERLLFGLQ